MSYQVIEKRRETYYFGPFASRRLARLWAKKNCVNVIVGASVPYEIRGVML